MASLTREADALAAECESLRDGLYATAERLHEEHGLDPAEALGPRLAAKVGDNLPSVGVKKEWVAVVRGSGLVPRQSACTRSTAWALQRRQGHRWQQQWVTILGCVGVKKGWVAVVGSSMLVTVWFVSCGTWL